MTTVKEVWLKIKKPIIITASILGFGFSAICGYSAYITIKAHNNQMAEANKIPNLEYHVKPTEVLKKSRIKYNNKEHISNYDYIGVWNISIKNTGSGILPGDSFYPKDKLRVVLNERDFKIIGAYISETNDYTDAKIEQLTDNIAYLSLYALEANDDINIKVIYTVIPDSFSMRDSIKVLGKTAFFDNPKSDRESEFYTSGIIRQTITISRGSEGSRKILLIIISSFAAFGFSLIGIIVSTKSKEEKIKKTREAIEKDIDKMRDLYEK